MGILEELSVISVFDDLYHFVLIHYDKICLFF